MPKILLIITGGIAGYKSLYLIRLLKDSGYDVHPVMTKSATEFVTPLSVSTLAGNPVRTDLFDLTEESDIGHIKMSRDVDMICVAPCTANFIAKIAMGIADDLASTLILGSDKPLLLAPAMNPVMWNNPATVNNISTLRNRGVHIIDPDSGDTACGELGVGRMSEPDVIAKKIKTMVQSNIVSMESGDLLGKSFIVTVGGTMESIDPVRVITNRSSGKQGFAITESLLSRGAKVTAIVGNVNCPAPRGAIILSVESAEEMLSATLRTIENNTIDGAIFCAAVADYKVRNVSSKKIKKEEGIFSLSFEENPDILHTISNHIKRPKLVIGFGAETQNTVDNARKKLERKNCDMIVANTVTKDSFGANQSTAYIVDKNTVVDLGTIPKTNLSLIITDYIKDKIC